MKRLGLVALVLAGAVCLTFYFFSCGGGNGGSDSGTLTLNIGPLGQNIALTEGVEFSIIFTDTYDVNALGGPFGTFGLDLADNLANIDFAAQGAGAALSEGAVPLQAGTGQMWMYIDRAEAVSTVCASENAFGPFNFTFNDSSQPTSVFPASAEAGQSSVDIINMGSLAICVRVVVPVDAEVSLDSVDFDTEDCGTQPADMDGTWTGPYMCDSNCGSFMGTVILTITQNPGNPSLATYVDDSDALYEGTVCGNRFNFSGGSESEEYSESGTFVMDGDAAVKTSTYRDYSGLCTGTCSDTLTRVD